ncbi:unnamed protein product [Mytilus edulis]|uniref:Uncharacterized protein n=1 Tax=Mytilus edulis TaxID=6550 RepID=A0A8S3PM61_MYTED|nr:unnamed protein product [Mytilus edulis]
MLVCGLEKNEGYCSKKEHCYSKGRYFYYDSKSGKCRPLVTKDMAVMQINFTAGKNADTHVEIRSATTNNNKTYEVHNNKTYEVPKYFSQMISEGYGNKCEVCPAPIYVYYTQCGCYSKGDCNCQPGYYCCPVTCGGNGKGSLEGYSCRKPIQVSLITCFIIEQPNIVIMLLLSDVLVKCARVMDKVHVEVAGKHKGNSDKVLLEIKDN